MEWAGRDEGGGVTCVQPLPSEPADPGARVECLLMEECTEQLVHFLLRKRASGVRLAWRRGQAVMVTSEQELHTCCVPSQSHRKDMM